ncbi:MAG: winged helix-turn-helix transcriptional regulator [Flavobacteriaceae bacterium]|nr:winged helix-turn-helix transcriptional regulator [Flavobacteriaceae bacterium]
MGASKINIHTKNHNKIAKIAKVFAHPARVAILYYISKKESCICNDIVDEIGLSQATISQHLQVIKNAGLLKGQFKGKRLCYCIDIKKLNEFQDVMNRYFIKTQVNSC